MRTKSTAQFTLRQRRARPAATTGAHATTRPSNGARFIAIYNSTCVVSGVVITADHATTRPSNGAVTGVR